MTTTRRGLFACTLATTVGETAVYIAYGHEKIGSFIKGMDIIPGEMR